MISLVPIEVSFDPKGTSPQRRKANSRAPLSVMRRVYRHFGAEPSRLHERRIEAWLREKPQTADGRHVYDPADFGWSYEGLAETWRSYRERYDIPRETR